MWGDDRDRPLKNSEIRAYTTLCVKLKAVNLAQGVFHVECRPEKRRFLEFQKAVLDEGIDQSGKVSYAPRNGIPDLLLEISQLEYTKNQPDRICYGIPDSVHDKNILVTAGALHGLHCVLEARLRPGDKVVMFQPFYSFHRDQLLVKDIDVRAVTLHPPDWSFDRQELAAAALGAKAIIINTPANPSGKVFTRKELEDIAEVCLAHDLLVISDEVYEYMIYNGQKHISLAYLPGMWNRTVKLASFGKMLGCTGVRLGYAVACGELIRQMGYSSEFEMACAPTPSQWAAARVLKEMRELGEEPFREHAAFFGAKRDFLCQGLEAAGWKFWRPDGAGYILIDVSDIKRDLGVATSKEVAVHMMFSPGVASVPAHDCYSNGTGYDQLRVCFGNVDSELRRGVDLLRAWDRKPSVLPAPIDELLAFAVAA